MLFVAWILACLTLVYVARRSPLTIAAAAFGVKTLVPAFETQRLFGSAALVEPATVLAILGLLVCALDDPVRLRTMIRRFAPIIAAYLLLVVCAMLSSVGLRSAYLNLIDGLIAPLCLLSLLLQGISGERGTDRRRLRNVTVTVAALASVEALLGIAQAVTGSSLVYAPGRAATGAAYFNNSAYVNSRAAGTLDTPLDLCFLLLVTLPYVPKIRRSMLRALALGAILGGVVSTASRTGLFVSLLLVPYVIITSERGIRRRVANFAVVVAVAVGGAVGGLASNLSARLSGTGASQNSVQVRSAAFEYVTARLGGSTLLGTGFGQGAELRVDGVLKSSPENALLSYSYEIGVIPTVAWFATVVVLALIALASARTRYAGIAILVACIEVTSFSSLSTSSASSFALALTVGIAAAELVQEVGPQFGHLLWVSSTELRPIRARSQPLQRDVAVLSVDMPHSGMERTVQ